MGRHRLATKALQDYPSNHPGIKGRGRNDENNRRDTNDRPATPGAGSPQSTKSHESPAPQRPDIPYGEPWTGDQAIRKTLWAHALKRAGVRYRRPYQTRHTYASMMVSAGEPLAWVSKQMGHTSVVTTARIYAGWIPTSNSQAGMFADQLFNLR